MNNLASSDFGLRKSYLLRGRSLICAQGPTTIGALGQCVELKDMSAAGLAGQARPLGPFNSRHRQPIGA